MSINENHCFYLVYFITYPAKLSYLYDIKYDIAAKCYFHILNYTFTKCGSDFLENLKFSKDNPRVSLPFDKGNNYTSTLMGGYFLKIDLVNTRNADRESHIAIGAYTSTKKAEQTCLLLMIVRLTAQSYLVPNLVESIDRR